VVVEVVKGVAEGCLQSECALVGGETAEMPGIYKIGEYDIAGFCTGIVDRKNIIDGRDVSVGDTIIGIASSGVHSNGFSLIRKIFDIDSGVAVLNEHYDELGTTLGETLITPTKIYVKAIQAAIATGHTKSIANITGGGFYENIPRAYKNICAKVKDGTWTVPPIFELMMNKANIPRDEMFGIFNMGIGMVVIVQKGHEKEVVEAINASGEQAYVIGEMVKYDGKEIEIC